MKIAIFGDSHSRLLAYNKLYAAYGMKMDSYVYRGASLVGLGKRTSTLGLHLKIAEIVEEKQHDLYVFKFGQVDIDLGFYYQSIFKEESLDIDAFIENALAIYKAYLDKLEVDNRKLLVHSINLPSIFDQVMARKYTQKVIAENATPEQVAEMSGRLADIFPTIIERTRRTMLFNRRLQAVFSGSGIAVTDPTPYFAEASTGLLKDAFILTAQNDHHYADTLEVRRIFAESLVKKILDMD